MTSEIADLVQLIEARYGLYSDDEREAVGGYLSGRLDSARLAQAFDAIRQDCPIRFGPPDEATVKKALVAYETETGTSLRRQGLERSVPEPELVSAEEEAQLREMAEKSGIDTSREGWMMRYFFRKCGELAEAKRFA